MKIFKRMMASRILKAAVRDGGKGNVLDLANITSRLKPGSHLQYKNKRKFKHKHKDDNRQSHAQSESCR